MTRVNGVVDYENEPMADRKESVYCFGIEVGTQDQWRLQWSRYATAQSPKFWRARARASGSVLWFLGCYGFWVVTV